MKITKRFTKLCSVCFVCFLTLAFLLFSDPTSYIVTGSNLTSGFGFSKETAFRYQTGITEYPWLELAHDNLRTGFTESSAPITNHTLWKFGGDGKDFYISFPTIADGKVFLAVQVPLPYDHIYALDAATGEQLWAWRPEGLPMGSGFQGAPVVDQGKIYFRTGTSLYCISEAEGDLMWEYDFGVPLGGISSVAVYNGKIYGLSMNSVWCIEAGYSQGYHPTLVWETFSDGNFTIDPQYSGIIGSPAVGEGKVFGIGRGSGDVFCLNATTGEWIWTVHTGEITQYTPTIYDGKVYYGNNNGDLYCWNADNGEEIWKHHFSLGVCWSATVAYDKVYAASYDGWFRAFEANTGDVVWEIDNTAANMPHPFLGYHGVWHSAPAVADNKVYLGAHDGYFYCWNAETGDEIWKYMVGGDVCAGPAIADGRVYVGSYYIYSQYQGQGTGEFYCFGKGPTTTKIRVTGSMIPYGSSTTIFGSVIDESPMHVGEPANGVQLNLAYRTDENWVNIGTVTTNSEGDFTYEWTPPAEGTYDIKADFPGNDDYEWSISETTIQVTAAAESFPEVPTASEVAEATVDQMPAYLAIDLAIIVLVIIAILIGLYGIFKKQK